MPHEYCEHFKNGNDRTEFEILKSMYSVLN